MAPHSSLRLRLCKMYRRNCWQSSLMRGPYFPSLKELGLGPEELSLLAAHRFAHWNAVQASSVSTAGIAALILLVKAPFFPVCNCIWVIIPWGGEITLVV